MVRHLTFSDKFSVCPNMFYFGQTSCPTKIGTVKPVYSGHHRDKFSDLIKEVAALSRSLCTQLAHVGIHIMASLDR